MINPIDIGAAGDGIANDGAFLAAAVLTGRDVCLPDECTFLMDGTQLQARPGQRFFGGGKLLKTSIPQATPITNAASFIDVTVDGVEIDGIAFECTQELGVGNREYGVTALGARDLVVQHCKFSGSVTPVHIFRGCTNTKILSNTMRSGLGGAFGIATGGDRAGNTSGYVYDTEISGNYITAYISEAIDINWDTHRCLIASNRCIANNRRTDGLAEEEIDIGGGDVSGCRDIIVTGNIIHSGGFGTVGICAKAAPLRTKNLIITDNIILGIKSGGKGIQLLSCDDAMLSDNRVTASWPVNIVSCTNVLGNNV